MPLQRSLPAHSLALVIFCVCSLARHPTAFLHLAVRSLLLLPSLLLCCIPVCVPSRSLSGLLTTLKSTLDYVESLRWVSRRSLSLVACDNARGGAIGAQVRACVDEPQRTSLTMSVGVDCYARRGCGTSCRNLLRHAACSRSGLGHCRGHGVVVTPPALVAKIQRFRLLLCLSSAACKGRSGRERAGWGHGLVIRFCHFKKWIADVQATIHTSTTRKQWMGLVLCCANSARRRLLDPVTRCLLLPSSRT